jgi:hypothetical protein
VKAGTGETTLGGFWGGNDAFHAQSSGTDVWNPGSSGSIVPGRYGMQFGGDWWHPQVTLSTAVTGDTTAHGITFYLDSGSIYPATAGIGNDFWGWCWMYIPGPNNPAYTGVTQAEVERWRQQLLHGTCPQSYTGGTGHAVTTASIDAPSYNVLNTSTGATSPFSTSNLGDWTDSGVANGYVPVWNSGTSKWTPGAQSGGGSGTVNNCTSAYALAYYAATGTAVSCPAAFTGLGYFSTGAPPAAANAHNESTPRTCVTTNSGNAYACATSPSFTPAAGDTISISFNAANTGSATLAVNGASAATVKKWGNSSNLAANDVLAGHWISATFDGADWQLEGQLGNANPPSLATTASSTIGGSANLFNNAAASTNIVEIQAGTTAAQTEEIQWQNYSGAAEWQNIVDSTAYTYHIKDAANSLDRVTIYQGAGNTNLNAGSGAYAVCLNCAANSGTGGLLVQNGASSPSTVLTVTGSGNTTATGFVSGRFFMGTSTMTLTAGAAAGSSPSIACASGHVCDGVSGTVTLTTGTSPTTGTLATLTFPNTHTNNANCLVSTQSASATITTNNWTESTTAITITASTALAASTPYTMRYWCGGN